MKRFLISLGVVAGLILGLGLLALYGIGWWLSPQDQLQKVDAIVAISGGETQSRAEEAVKLYADGWAGKIIFSGAAQDPTGPSNAEAMKRLAVTMGVRPEDIITEDLSPNTLANAVFVNRILQTRGYTSIILVTSPYHQRRANLLFRAQMGQRAVIVNHSTIDHNWRRSYWWANNYSRRVTLDELGKTLFVLWGGKKATELQQG